MNAKKHNFWTFSSSTYGSPTNEKKPLNPEHPGPEASPYTIIIYC